MGVLDLIFPKRCIGCKTVSSYLCTKCFTRISFSTVSICFVCNRASFNGLTHPGCHKPQMIDGIYSSLVYSGIVKKLVYQFKYQPYLTDLKPVLIDLFYEGIIQHEELKDALQKSILVPIPLFAAKHRKRGYNQAEILAEGLAKRGLAPQGIGQKTDLPVMNVLIRTKQTVSQFTLDREKRKINMQDAFALKKENKDDIKDSSVLLVDDVVTSGATMIEAAKILKRAGAKTVFGITLAHGQ